MSAIKSIRLSATPKVASLGDKIVFDITTVDAAGNDTGEDEVVGEGLCFATGHTVEWAPDAGAATRSEIFGTGGTYRNPNPGYSLETPEGLNCGSSRWIWTNGFSAFIKHFAEAGPGWIRVKGHLRLPTGTIDTQTVEVRVG